MHYNTQRKAFVRGTLVAVVALTIRKSYPTVAGLKVLTHFSKKLLSGGFKGPHTFQ